MARPDISNVNYFSLSIFPYPWSPLKHVKIDVAMPVNPFQDMVDGAQMCAELYKGCTREFLRGCATMMLQGMQGMYGFPKSPPNRLVSREGDVLFVMFGKNQPALTYNEVAPR